ncbi:MAG: methyl-accepting chemotaxis protein [Deltaproteobacteria bacterium]|nr:methyl-accepting chemotaxis protein [Candidatus Tharpella aukensis]
MSLKVKLILFITFFALLPISFLGIFQSFDRYQEEMKSVKESLTLGLESQKRIFVRFTDGLCQDIEFASRSMAVNKLLTGVEDEDNDEIEYWTETLTEVLLTFAENRQIFSDLRFSVSGDLGTIISLTYSDGKAQQAKKIAAPPGYKKAITIEKPSAVWLKNKSRPVLWLHYFVQMGEEKALLSVAVNLDHFYELVRDRDIYLSSAVTGEIIIAGLRTTSESQSQHIFIDKKSAAGDNNITVTDDNVLSATTFPLIKWQPEQLFTLAKVKNKASLMAPLRRGIIQIIIICLLATLAAAGCGYFFMSKMLVRPILQATKFADLVAGGDLRSTLVIGSRNDELGSLVKALNNMVNSMKSMIHDIQRSVSTLTEVGSEMNQVSDTLEAGAETTMAKTRTVTSAAQESSTHMSSVTSSMSETSMKVDTIAAAAEEMNINIGEIVGNVEQVQETIRKTVATFENVQTHIKELNQDASQIGDVTGSIAAISSKTNLLALNATIEAARAGEAGKGFAVVANEIKDLSRQTADSTTEIDGKLLAIQHSAKSVTQNIDNLSEGINLIEEAFYAISDSIVQQNTATGEIAENISQTSLGIREASENVSSTNDAAEQIAAEVVEVNRLAQEIGQLSADSKENVGRLHQLSDSLKKDVTKFTIT